MKAIEVNGVWKKYRKGEKFYSLRDLIPHITRNLFQRRNAGNGELAKEEFWALQDVSFYVAKGEILGIIGANGAGKSTILKLLTKIIKPYRGEIKVHGRLSALIEVTAGFHPDFTGRENVYFNGAVYGMKKKEIDRKFDQIVEFSGVHEFIDTPVKRYSSGMSARLGFAIAAHVDPEVLLVDEVLSVGDMNFQSRCVDKIRELLKSGTTIIFISHNISLVQNLCKRVILLERGKIIRSGIPNEVIPYYENSSLQQQEQIIKSRISKMEKNDKESNLQDNAACHVLNVRVCDHAGNKKEIFEFKEPLELHIDYMVTGAAQDIAISYEIIRSDGASCLAGSSLRDGFPLNNIQGKNSLKIKLSSFPLAPEAYYIKVSILDKDMLHSHVLERKGIFSVRSGIVGAKTKAILIPKAEWMTLGSQIRN